MDNTNSDLSEGIFTVTSYSPTTVLLCSYIIFFSLLLATYINSSNSKDDYQRKSKYNYVL